MAEVDPTEVVEVWKPVVGWEAYYEVSSLGRVRSACDRGQGCFRTFKGRILQLQDTGGGYKFVLLCPGPRRCKVHRLVAVAFLGPPPFPRAEVNHKNGLPADNRVENLEWCSHRQNMQHQYRVLGKVGGPAPHGEQHWKSMLTEADVRAMRFLASRGIGNPELARLFGVRPQTVGRIINRKAWKHVL